MNINQKELIQQAKVFLRDKGMSQNDLAPRMGCSSSIVSQLLNDQYTGDNRFWLLQLAAIIDYVPSSRRWLYVRTQNVERIKDICLEAQEDLRMVAIYGNTGMGKTTTLKNIVRKSENAWYVLADVNMRKKDFINAILKELGLEASGSISDKIDAIVRFLTGCNNPLLVIDDIGKFAVGSKANFYQIQLLYDRLKGMCGIVLSGMPAFKSFMQKMCEKDVPGFRELNRRISYWMPLGTVEAKFVDAVCRVYGIDDRKVASFIMNRCQNYGDVENMMEAYEKALLKITTPVSALHLLESLNVK